jgi:hypothetical protein
MLLLLLGVGGCVAGVLLSRKHGERIEKAEAGAPTSAARKAIKDGRRALFIGHTIVRAQMSRAFVATARYSSQLAAQLSSMCSEARPSRPP